MPPKLTNGWANTCELHTRLHHEDCAGYQLFVSHYSKGFSVSTFFVAYRAGAFDLAVSGDILLEYQEICSQKMTPPIAENIIELMLKQPNTIQTEIFYRWHLIIADPDDNKFTDTAISAAADCIVSNDAHFRVLHDIPFPRVSVMTLVEFMAHWQQRKQ